MRKMIIPLLLCLVLAVPAMGEEGLPYYLSRYLMLSPQGGGSDYTLRGTLEIDRETADAFLAANGVEDRIRRPQALLEGAECTGRMLGIDGSFSTTEEAIALLGEPDYIHTDGDTLFWLPEDPMMVPAYMLCEHYLDAEGRSVQLVIYAGEGARYFSWESPVVKVKTTVNEAGLATYGTSEEVDGDTQALLFCIPEADLERWGDPEADLVSYMLFSSELSLEELRAYAESM